MRTARVALGDNSPGRRRLLQACFALGLTLHAAYLYTAQRFGRHFPNGNDAVAYLYGPNGMWREQTNVYYGWDFLQTLRNAQPPARPASDAARIVGQR